MTVPENLIQVAVPDAVAEEHASCEHRLLWSGLLPMWLRKHGFLFRKAVPCAERFVVAGRGVRSPDRFGSGLYEGPLDTSVLRCLGLSASTHAAETVAIDVVETGERFSGMAYGRDILRRIPERRGESSEPYMWRPDDPRLGFSQVPVQAFALSPGWEVIATARLDDDDRALPVVVSNGRTTVLGLPLFDMVVRKHWMPPISDAYYAYEHDPFPIEAESWLARLVREHALRAGATVAVIDPWPNRCRSALTVRLDHDRPISTGSLVALLDLLDRHSLRASWGFLVRTDAVDIIAEAVRRGHEIVLHTEAANEGRFRDELDALRGQGWHVAGVTAHGGIGSAGHLGQIYFAWAERAGLSHADILSRHIGMPHPAISVRARSITCGDLMLPSAHYSLDTGTRPDAHRLADLLSLVPARLMAGHHVTIMNHPDIHRNELEHLFDALALDDVWRASHAEVCDWVAATRFGWQLDSTLTIRFQRQLSGTATVRWSGSQGEGEVDYSGSAGGTAVAGGWGMSLHG